VPRCKAREGPQVKRTSCTLRLSVTSILLSILPAAVLLCLLCAQFSCGVKAPPQPRDTVVPGPVLDLSVQFQKDGVHLTFTLPAKSLDGSRLERIGGYRILRQGPDGKKVRTEILFSTTQQVEMRGEGVSYVDQLPDQAGDFRFCVVPLDPYGSHPRNFIWVGAYWPGSGVGPESREAESP